MLFDFILNLLYNKYIDNEVKIGIDLKSRSNIPINRASDNKYMVDSIIFDLINREKE